MLALLLAGCDSTRPETVIASDYDQFWLWAGVVAPKDLSRAKAVYILDSEIRGEPSVRVDLRPGVPRAAGPELWMVVRTDQIPWSDKVESELLGELNRWSAAEGHVAGLQVDFDAKTRGLSQYAAFLAGLRERLPERYRLSITGLMDWSANGDPRALASLKGVVDEVVIQTYQGRSTILGYERYFDRMKGFPLPFKVGLVEHGQWSEPANLRQESNFRGYVVFLVPPKRT